MGSRIIWEFFSAFDGTVIVPDLTLTYIQKNTLVPTKIVEPGAPSYSNTDFHLLKADIEAGTMRWSDACSLITSLKGRPWATKSCKERRDLIIKDACEACGAQNTQFVLQHTRQPRKPDTVINDLFRRRRAEYEGWVTENGADIDYSTYPKDANACPQCKSQVIYFRQRKGSWICKGVTGGQQCGYVFVDPIKEISKGIVYRLQKDATDTLKNRFIDISGIGKEATLAAIDEMITYLEMKNSKTLCQRCAFVEDQTEMILCAICGKNYHRISYDRCSKCKAVDADAV